MISISAITPSHDLKHILELYESLKRQTHTPWEWILLLNGNAITQIEEDQYRELRDNDHRVKIHFDKTGNTKVGYLKNKAFSLANSTILVEVDHDDILVDTCLEKVYKAFAENPNVGFVYSKDAKLAEEFVPYDPQYGWTHDTFAYESDLLTSMNCLPITPGNISHIWWSPNHVRAWRKTVYDYIEGHNPDLEICDDNDLMCRTYLATEFHYIPEVLYIYRIESDSSNTWLRKAEDIQNLTRQIGEQYIEAIALEWSKRNGLKAIDLCGGFNSPPGYLSVDLEGGDITADLDEPWHLEDGSVGVVRAFDSIEHLKSPIHTMKEVWRVLAPGGVFLSMTPSTDGRGAFQDPTHVSFWNENSFWYWTEPQIAAYIKNEECIFRNIKVETFYPSEWHQQHHILYVKAILDKTPLNVDPSYYK